MRRWATLLLRSLAVSMLMMSASLPQAVWSTGAQAHSPYKHVLKTASLPHVENATPSPFNQPVVSIAVPMSSQTFPQGYPIIFAGRASILQEGDASTSLIWISDLDGLIGRGIAFMNSTLSAGYHTITAIALDGRGQSITARISLSIDGPGNDRPLVSITAFADGQEFTTGEAIPFIATARDIEDGDLTTRITWESNIDGPLATGGTFTLSDLSEADHTITATVTDSGGLAAAGYVTVSIKSATHVLLAAGDIAGCGSEKDEETAALLDGLPGTVLTLGDNVYPVGTDANFANCYDPTWGRHKDRTRPTLGNHEYLDPGAQGYFNYFGAAAGEMGKGYYSFDVGDWHIIALNSECSAIGGCGIGDPQGQWLQADLAANPSACTLAYWHRPRFSSGKQGNKSTVRPFWDLLYAAGADVVLNGHDHTYERFAPQDPAGNADPGRGIREFVVGTGGKTLYDFRVPKPNSEVRNNLAPGVLKLTLHPTSYEWEFVPIAGQTFTDSGSAECVAFSPLSSAP